MIIGYNYKFKHSQRLEGNNGLILRLVGVYLQLFRILIIIIKLLTIQNFLYIIPKENKRKYMYKKLTPHLKRGDESVSGENRETRGV